MKPLIFSVPSYDRLAKDLCRASGLPAGSVEREVFPDGERYVRIASPVAGRDAVVVGGTIDDGACLDVFDLACGLVKEGCRSLTLLIPYFGYSTMERAAKRGEVVTAKNRARLLSAIPPAPLGNRVALLDLHSDGITHYFEGGVVPAHLYAKPLILKAARAAGGKGFVMACVDSGRAKWVESLANDLGTTAAFVFKRRIDGRRTEIVGISADVKNKPVVIYDDMIRTGGSLIDAARAYKKAGASKVVAIATHGVFAEGAFEKLKSCGLFEKIVVTDSHPAALAPRGRFLQVVSTAPVFSAFLRGNYHETH
ncbi:MAG: ribose-phosphate pyrophosphokinase [Elusimicrobia bacterium]|nr:ribose-phosphate pyrophosphokinase [Elusimicrobiota bacterium]